MKNPEKLINNRAIQSIIRLLGYRVSGYIFQKGLFPLIYPKKQFQLVNQQVEYVFKSLLRQSLDGDVKKQVDSFWRHYKQKFSDDCIVLNFGYDGLSDLFDKHVRIEGDQHLLDAVNQGHGILAVGSHVGSVLMGTVAMLLAYSTVPLEKVVGVKICTEPDVPNFPVILNCLQTAVAKFDRDVTFLLTRRAKKDVSIDMVDALNQKYMVTTNMDVLTGGGSTREFNLFGTVPVYMPAIVGAVKVALKTGATILPWTNRNVSGGKLVLSFETPIFPTVQQISDVRLHPDFDILCDTLFRIFERWLKASPTQWVYWDRFHKKVVRK